MCRIFGSSIHLLIHDLLSNNLSVNEINKNQISLETNDDRHVIFYVISTRTNKLKNVVVSMLVLLSLNVSLGSIAGKFVLEDM